MDRDDKVAVGGGCLLMTGLMILYFGLPLLFIFLLIKLLQGTGIL